RFSSQRLYGTVSDSLLDTAQRLLAAVPAARRRAPDAVDARAFRDRALAELDHYRPRYPAPSTTAGVRPGVRRLRVPRGHLLIGQGLQPHPPRAAPPIHHQAG